MNKQSGSAIFIILIAVALFAALGFAFMQGSRTSSSMMTDEAARAYAGQVIAYGNDVKTSVKRMVLRGTPPAQISFETSVFTFQNGNPVFPVGSNPTCTSSSCQVFSTSGGGLSPIVISHGATYLDPTMASPSRLMAGHWIPYYLNMNNVGTTTSDLTYAASFISKQVCIEINKMLGVDNPSGLPPVFSLGSVANVIGQQPPTGEAVFNDLPALSGKRAFCGTQGAFAHLFYSYYVVLIEN